MRYSFLCLLMLLAWSSCKVTNRMTKKELQEQARLVRARVVADSLAQVARLDSLVQVQAQARRDSIRVADSLAALPPPINYDTVLVASLLRSPCYGKCPHYEIRLYASGYATFEGLAHVKWLGRYEARLSPAVADTLLSRANQIGYFNFSESYPTKGRGIEDFPLCVSAICRAGEKKIIYNRNDAPKQLVKYEQYFDSLFENVGWKEIKR